MVFTYIGGKVLRTIPLTTTEWVLVVGACFIIIPWDTIRKVLIAPILPNRFVDTSGLDDEDKKEN